MATASKKTEPNTKGKTSAIAALASEVPNKLQPIPGSTLSKDDVVFLGATIVEAARMIGVRDSSASAYSFNNSIRVMEKLYDEFYGK